MGGNRVKIILDKQNDLPIYQQIVNAFISGIQSGALPPGHKLPTVRELARDSGLSQGTAKHAYDLLAQLGYIERTQGRGTFVSAPSATQQGSKKELALEAIDQLLDQMAGWRFSTQEMRIFLDLKLREREEGIRHVKIAAVDCCPEALHAMCRQIMAIPRIDVQEYLLAPVLGLPATFEPDADIIVTTPTHFQELAEKTAPNQNLLRLVMAVSRDTLMALARIARDARVGILCSSERFADIIIRACNNYNVLSARPEIAYFGDAAAIERLLARCDQIILPSEFHQWASPQEQALIREKTMKRPPVYFQYLIGRGSVLHLEEEVAAYEKNHRAM